MSINTDNINQYSIECLLQGYTYN